MNKGKPFFLLHLDGVRGGVRKAVADQNDFAAQIPDRLNLQVRRSHGHHNHGTAPQAPCRQCHALCMVTG